MKGRLETAEGHKNKAINEIKQAWNEIGYKDRKQWERDLILVPANRTFTESQEL